MQTTLYLFAYNRKVSHVSNIFDKLLSFVTFFHGTTKEEKMMVKHDLTPEKIREARHIYHRCATSMGIVALSACLFSFLYIKLNIWLLRDMGAMNLVAVSVYVFAILHYTYEPFLWGPWHQPHRFERMVADQIEQKPRWVRVAVTVTIGATSFLIFVGVMIITTIVVIVKSIAALIDYTK